MKRRTFLQSTLAGSVITIAAGAGLLKPTDAFAARWPKKAFNTKKDVNKAISALYGSSSTIASDKISIKAPIQAENGNLVPVKVTAKMPGVQSIALLVSGNPRPLATSIDLSGAKGYYRANLKMRKTSNLNVIVKAGGKLYKKVQKIKVTVGGCGG